MKTDKLREALSDLQRQRDLIDKAIESIQLVLVQSESDGTMRDSVSTQGIPFVAKSLFALDKKLSYVEAAVKILENTGGRPMHVKHITAQIKILRGDPNIKRQSVESTLIRHIQMKGEQAKVAKVSPGFYGLPTRQPRTAQA